MEKIIVREARNREDMLRAAELSFYRVWDEADFSDVTIALEVERWLARLSAFPQGQFIAIDAHSDKVVSASSTQIINWNYGDAIPPWVEGTDNGKISNTHKTDGNTLHIVTAATDREYRGKRLNLGELTLQKQTEMYNLLKSQGKIKYFIVGHMFPTFADYVKHKLSRGPEHITEKDVSSYVDTVDSAGRPIDPLMRFYWKCGFRVAKIIPNYEQYVPALNWGCVQVYQPETNGVMAKRIA